MPDIEPIGMEAATGRAAELLDELAARGGEPRPRQGTAESPSPNAARAG